MPPKCTPCNKHQGPGIAVELWCGWLQMQLDSELTQRFNQYFAAGGKRMPCVGIIAVARWLAIALWCRLELREIPFRTTLKIQTPHEADPPRRARPTAFRASS